MSPDPDDVEAFMRRWGVAGAPVLERAARRVTMVKRSPGSFGRTLGKTTGWIVRQELKDYGVRQIPGVTYQRIAKDGLHISIDGKDEILPADTIVVCAGQVSDRALADELEAVGQSVHVIGGARLAGELDAKRAIKEGAKAATLI
jgi:2,4-dienoyl-CoA reductase (NADPH2)